MAESLKNDSNIAAVDDADYNTAPPAAAAAGDGFVNVPDGNVDDLPFN